jgi:hypothetical protein
VQITTIPSAIEISAGNDNGYAVDANPNFIWAWGNNAGQIGNGGTGPYKTSPVQYNPGFTTLALATGDCNAHMLASATDLYLHGWGANTYGQIGNNDTTTQNTTTQTAPVPSFLFSSLHAPVLYGNVNTDDISWDLDPYASVPQWRVEQYQQDGMGGSWQPYPFFLPGTDQWPPPPTSATGIGDGNALRIIGVDDSNIPLTQYSDIVPTF